ncbi:MAG TPA: bifunctional DNA-formamidopyrimidine glycosylase/DNA-(apurinic or apyrimidinic site) lyase [Mycobacteriales bacterium]|nr:bifunctional DNA-formamidopyrimidine glycosylase/DNA-(apurinic or apyrimidinic site) lyase [Mycobacteriales bacterium]
MPELPEVETVRRGLEKWVVGRRIAEVEVFGERTLRRHVAGEHDFVARLTGRRVIAARRRGKYLWLPLDDATNLLAHLGMSGQFLSVAPQEPPNRHLRARWRFDDGGAELRFCDQRTFGGLALADERLTPDGVPAVLAHVAPDPLEPAFDAARFSARLRRRHTGIKRALLDQTLISGIGNIYADEALWRARLHFERPTNRLRPADVGRLLDAVEEVLRAAIAAGGTSFDALYVAVNGESGWFDRSLEAYGRDGRPCSRCGTPIVRVSFTNRSSYFCPRCQRPPLDRRSGERHT